MSTNVQLLLLLGIHDIGNCECCVSHLILTRGCGKDIREVLLVCFHFITLVVIELRASPLDVG